MKQPVSLQCLPHQLKALRMVAGTRTDHFNHRLVGGFDFIVFHQFEFPGKNCPQLLLDNLLGIAALTLNVQFKDRCGFGPEHFRTSCKAEVQNAEKAEDAKVKLFLCWKIQRTVQETNGKDEFSGSIQAG